MSPAPLAGQGAGAALPLIAIMTERQSLSVRTSGGAAQRSGEAVRNTARVAILSQWCANTNDPQRIVSRLRLGLARPGDAHRHARRNGDLFHHPPYPQLRWRPHQTDLLDRHLAGCDVRGQPGGLPRTDEPLAAFLRS